MPFVEVVQYMHAVSLLNGNATKWTNEDKEKTEEDLTFITGLDI